MGIGLNINGLSSLTAGETYFLSESSAGTLTAVEPSGDYISKPVLLTDSGTSGYSGYSGISGYSGYSGVLPTVTAVPGSDHTASGITIVLTSNGTFNFGDVGYIDGSGTVSFGDASVIATSSAIVMCADEQIASASGNWLLLGIARNDTWTWTVGGLVYLSITGTTGNTMSQTKPSATNEVVQVLGVATHADRMYFNPNLAQVELT